jgi:hypothetical protein
MKIENELKLEDVSFHDIAEELKRRIKLGFGVEKDLIRVLDLEVEKEVEIEIEPDIDIEDFSGQEIIDEAVSRASNDRFFEAEILSGLVENIPYKPESLDEQIKFDLYLEHKDKVTMSQLKNFFEQI